MLLRRLEHGKKPPYPLWINGEGVMQWWVGDYIKNDPGQLSLFDDEWEDE